MNEPSLQDHHLLPSVRGDLLARLDRLDEARIEFERAASLTRNAKEHAQRLSRASRCDKVMNGLKMERDRIL